MRGRDRFQKPFRSGRKGYHQERWNTESPFALPPALTSTEDNAKICDCCSLDGYRHRGLCSKQHVIGQQMLSAGDAIEDRMAEGVQPYARLTETTYQIPGIRRNLHVVAVKQESRAAQFGVV